MNKKLFYITTVVTMFFAISCGKEKKPNNVVKTTESIVFEDKNQSHWHVSDKKICVIFGYGYNDEKFTKSTIEALSTKYGLDDGTPESGLIYPLIYPEDFKVGSNARVSSLVDKLEDKDMAGIITIGAPEYMNYALSKLEEEWDNMLPFPVYSIVPQDEVLAIEAVSNFVLDKAVEAPKEGADTSKKDISEEEKTPSGEAEATDQVVITEMPEILNRAIDYMLLTKEPLKNDENLIKHVQRIAGSDFEIVPYVDAETGIKSSNHFVLINKK